MLDSIASITKLQRLMIYVHILISDLSFDKSNGTMVKGLHCPSRSRLPDAYRSMYGPW